MMSASPQQPPFPGGSDVDPAAAIAHPNHQSQPRQPADDGGEEERSSLISEILRLEQSMNLALRASRDEMESLKEKADRKRDEIRRMEEELAEVMKQIGDGSGSGAGAGAGQHGHGAQGNHHPKDQQQQHQRPSTPDSMRTSLLRQNSMFRRVSVSGDRPFFRRPTLAGSEDEEKLRESLRRRSDPSQPRPEIAAAAPGGGGAAQQTNRGNHQRNGSSGFFVRRASDSSGAKEKHHEHQQSQGGGGGGMGLGRSLSTLSLGNYFQQNSNHKDDDSSDSDSDRVGSQSGARSVVDIINTINDDQLHEETDPELVRLREAIESKDEKVAELQKQESSYSSQLRYLRSRLQSVQNQSRT